MKIADYFYCTPDRQWDYAAQLGVRYAAGRMPDGQMERTAGSFELLREMKERFEARGFSLKVIEPAPPNQKIKQGLPGRDEEIERMVKASSINVTDETHETVVKGDKVELKLYTTMDGKKVRPLCTEGRQYSTGSQTMPDDFDEAIIGMKVGETKTFTFLGLSLIHISEPTRPY